MPKFYKCPICGCTEYYEIPSIRRGEDRETCLKNGTKIKLSPRYLLNVDIDIHGDAWLRQNIDFNASVCLCKKCSHIDLFNEPMLESIKADEKEFKERIVFINEQLIKNEDEKKNIELKLEANNEKVSSLTKKLKDEDITIRMHNEAEKQLKTIKSDINDLQRQLADLSNISNELKEDLSQTEEYLKNITKQMRIFL